MEDRLFSIIRNLREYGNYKKSDSNAAKILKKAHPELGLDEALGLIAHFGGMYERLSQEVDLHRDEALLLYQAQRIEALVDRALGPQWFEPHRDRCDARLLAIQMAYFIVHWHIER